MINKYQEKFLKHSPLYYMICSTNNIENPFDLTSGRKSIYGKINDENKLIKIKEFEDNDITLYHNIYTIFVHHVIVEKIIGYTKENKPINFNFVDFSNKHYFSKSTSNSYDLLKRSIKQENDYQYSSRQWYQSTLEPFGDKTIFFIQLDFSKHDELITKIEIKFKTDIIDPVIIDIEYDLISKEMRNQKNSRIQKIIDDKKEKEDLEKRIEYRKKHTSCEVGLNLVNIYFKSYDDPKYKYTVIDIFRDSFKLSTNKMKDTYFLSVDKLAYGKYYWVLKHYDIDNNVLYESDKVEFQIK